MSWVFMVSVVVLIAAIVLIELRAVREGDERRHHAPGYALVLGGLVAICIGVAAAMQELAFLALAASGIGLLFVVLGATRHAGAAAQ